ncbi:hypothetical protein niasHT_037115 [Heterodera trifolii]|uniref:RRM domain-containing protein n=1 Tax=Heterodera trifolii TaxID=157864 RepID=A0ABD2ITP0_9BILA
MVVNIYKSKYAKRKTEGISLISQVKEIEEIERLTFDENKSIFVSRFLLLHTNEWHIRQLFSHCGTITFVAVFQKAFRVDFTEKRMAAFAIWSMNGKYWGETEEKKFICDWWKWKSEKTKEILIGKLSEERQKYGEKLKEMSSSRKTKEEILILPLTNRSVLPFPAPPFECLSTSESEYEMENEPTEAAKLAEEFANKNLTMKERMEALLKMISGRSGEEEGAVEEEKREEQDEEEKEDEEKEKDEDEKMTGEELEEREEDEEEVELEEREEEDLEVMEELEEVEALEELEEEEKLKKERKRGGGGRRRRRAGREGGKREGSGRKEAGRVAKEAKKQFIVLKSSYKPLRR